MSLSGQEHGNASLFIGGGTLGHTHGYSRLIPGLHSETSPGSAEGHFVVLGSCMLGKHPTHFTLFTA